MGTAIVKIKIMPASPDTDLDAVRDAAKEIISKNTESDINVEVEPIAFGLKALYLIFAIDEAKSIDQIEIPIKELADVNSAEVVDFRRALG
ncbi:elongation factor 1-beta [Candidatus Pacearchaeota archaeon]|nr:elongation factor 1-beta [Candidatus Pacearchaeota archaeon]